MENQNHIVFSQQISFLELLTINYYLYFRSRLGIFYTIIGCFSLMGSFSQLSFSPNKAFYDKSEFIFSLATLIGIPFFIFFKSRKDYSNKYSQIINFEIDSEKINVISESSTFSHKLVNLHKIKESKNWIFLYINRHNAIYISKSLLKTTNNLDNFINLFPKKLYLKILNQLDIPNSNNNLTKKIFGYILKYSSVVCIAFLVFIYIILALDNEFNQVLDIFTSFIFLIPIAFCVWIFYIGKKMIKNN